jgi:hypothetical protein
MYQYASSISFGKQLRYVARCIALAVPLPTNER